MNHQKIRYLTQAAAVAALYVLLSLLSNAFGLANGVIQIRLSEMLTVLPFFMPAAIPGLTAGCLLANLLTGCIPIDTLIGSLTTLAAALLTARIGHFFRKKHTAEASPAAGQQHFKKAGIFLAPLPPVLLNALTVPLLFRFAYGIEGSYLFFFCTVGLGELISAGVLGSLLLLTLKKRSGSLLK